MKNLLKNIFWGITAGCMLNTAAGLLFTHGKTRQQILLSLLLALVIGAAAAIFEVEKLSLLAKTSCHLIISSIAFLVIAYLGKWFPFQIASIATAVLLFIGIFLIIWTIFYQLEKRALRRINQKLKM